MKFSSFYILIAFALAFVCAACNTPQRITLPKEVSILTRQQWEANAPLLPMRTHKVKRITIHHTAVKQNLSRSLTDKLKGLQKFSQQKSALADGRIKVPWADIPYHFYIAVDGAIGEGRELKYVGDSNTPYHPSGHALIVLEGNFNIEEVTADQYANLERLTLALARQYGIDSSMISGHKDHAETGCPGNKLYAMLPGLKAVLGSVRTK